MADKVLIAVVSVGVGALLGGVVNSMVRLYWDFRESKGIASALRAEIGSLILLITHRNYIKHVEKRIERLSAEDYEPTEHDLFAISVKQDYFTVFHAIAPKVGLLGAQARHVVELYNIGRSLLEDLHEEVRTLDNLRDDKVTLIRIGMLENQKNIKQLLETVIVRGQQVSDQLVRYEQRRFLGIFL